MDFRDKVLKWDWYEASLPEALGSHVVLRALGTGLAAGGQWEPCRALHGYAGGVDLKGVEVGSVKVLWKGDGVEVHVQATGAAADWVAPILRERWPDHRVSRADIAYDVVEPGSFDRLYESVHVLARSNPRGKVSTSTVGDWIDRENGRTFYAGGKDSRVRVRVYEKDLEQLAKDPGCGAPRGWTRVEWQLRPASSEKAWLARASKVEALGLSTFGARVGAELLGGEVVSVGGVLRFASTDPAYWMVRSYRTVVGDLLGLDADDAMARLAELAKQVDAIRDPRRATCVRD